MWNVYIVKCSDGSLYTGITTDLKRRLKQHNSGAGGSYTRLHRPVKLSYHEFQPDRPSALIREAGIKRWSRKRKIALIKSGRKNKI
jgi:putative endonuclease